MGSKGIICFLALFALLVISPVVDALSFSPTQNPLQRYFPETGHTVSGEFLTFFQNAKDPLQLYGYPITEAFQEKESAIIVQYFQRARFEYLPKTKEGIRVRLSPLGQLLYRPNGETARVIPANPLVCQYYQMTNHSICYDFLKFYQANGEVEQFGYPISELEWENNRIVQYFQYARLEWHPEFPNGNRVVVSDLGTIYFQTSEEDESRLRPVAAAFIHQKILDLRVHAFVSKEGRHVPSSAERDYTLYVVVQDQNKYPVPGAVIVFSIQGNGKEETHRMPLPTNEEGFTSTTIRVRRISDYQMYKILIRVEHSGMEKITETAFWVGN